MIKLFACAAFCSSLLAPAYAANKLPVNRAHHATFTQAVEQLENYRGDSAALESARLQLHTVLEAEPRFAPAHREMARYLIMKGHISGSQFQPGTLEAADAALRKALVINPAYAEAYVLYGHLYRLMGKPGEALAALKKAEKLGTSDPWLHSNWADLLIMQGNYKEAGRRYQAVIDSGTKNKKAMGAAFEGLVTYYRDEVGDLKKADSVFRERIAFEPDNAWGHGNYAIFLLCTTNDYESAITRSRQALKIMNYGAARFWLAAALYRKWATSVVEGPHQDRATYLEAQALLANPGDLMVYTNSCPTLRVLATALGRVQQSPDLQNR